MESPKGYPNSWIGWLSLVLWQLPRALLRAIVRALLATKSFAAGSSSYLHHMACVSKSVMKDIISLSDYVPNSTEALWMRCAIVGADHSASLSRDCEVQVRKEVLLRYCFCCVKKSVSGTAFAHGLLVEKGTQEPILQTKRVACELRYSWTKKKEFLVLGHVNVALVRSLSYKILCFLELSES